MKQYLKKWALSVNGDVFIESGTERQLRTVFDIVVSPQNAQSFADIRIYNLSKETIIEQGASVTFSAGYLDNFDVIFIGTVTNVLRERDGPDIATRILCRNGAPKTDRGSANSSYGPGTSVVDVIRDLARSWPRFLEIEEEQFDGVPFFTSGFVVDGDIPQILDDLAYQFDFTWVQDRGTIVVTRNGKERTTPVFEVNQYTGMMGIPEVNRGPAGLGVNVAVRINPYIRANSRINVRSEFSTFSTGNIFISELLGDASASGQYNVLTMSYSGDSHGDSWDLLLDAIRPSSAPEEAAAPSVTAESSTGALVWGAKVSKEFRAKVREIAEDLNINADWLMSVMAFETGKTFDPSQPNLAGGGATGLIQFLPSTARALGTTTGALSRMTAAQQLDFVEKYYAQYSSRIRNLGDAYMAVLWPAAIGKPDSFVMWTSSGLTERQYNANAGLDKNQNGQITRGEAVERVEKMFIEGQKFLR
ncbi:hypothetical protein [uncultured Methylophaga sp.]|uniref:hypothetical protein n=1 Tax=uncultured Methylophaga sp. TaxID=285271 RepID=UPI0030F77B88